MARRVTFRWFGSVTTRFLVSLAVLTFSAWVNDASSRTRVIVGATGAYVQQFSSLFEQTRARCCLYAPTAEDATLASQRSPVTSLSASILLSCRRLHCPLLFTDTPVSLLLLTAWKHLHFQRSLCEVDTSSKHHAHFAFVFVCL